MPRQARRRASNGEGSVYQQANGLWAAVVTVEGRRVFRRAKTRALADAARRKLLDQRDEGTLRPGRTPTVGEWLDHWLEQVVRPVRRQTTARGYEVVIRRFLKPAFGFVKLDKLRPPEVRRMLTAMGEMVNPRTNRQYAPKYVREARLILHAAIHQAVRDGLVSRNVVDAVAGPSVDVKEVAVFTAEEAAKLIRAVRGDRFEALYLLVLSLGLRQGEALGLTWNDVDIEKGVVHVRQQLQRLDGRLQLVPLKTAKSRRTLVLPEFLVRVLLEHRARQAEMTVRSARGLVFTNTVGQPEDARHLIRLWTSLLRDVGLEHRKFHTTRHTAATFMRAAGVDLKVVQEVLGHAQLGTTADIYTHVPDEMKRDVAGRMDALLGGLSDPTTAPVAAPAHRARGAR